MCGIAGAIGFINKDIVNAVARASDRQRHRGPDDEGQWQSECEDERGAAFAFRRLAIIDLTADGHQPMTDPDSGNVIVFNGEIYNYRELRRELESVGARFHSQSDTEVILKAYAQWGLSAIAHLRGMFAFALWNAKRNTVVLARDRLGIKPLYVTRVNGSSRQATLLFASELRSLLATNLVERRINPRAVEGYLWNGFVVGPDTIIDGINLFPAGTYAEIDAATGTESRTTYWQLPGERTEPVDDAVERLDIELNTAISQHMISDVPLGVFLSGGIDSSAISALAAKHGAGGLRTFNISFDEAQFDESKYAQAVAEAIGSEHCDVRVTQRHFNEQLSDALGSLDQPTFDAINTYFVSRAVREAGMTVALAGTGGDELFGGYRSFRDVPRTARISRRLRSVPEGALRTVAAGVVRAKIGRFGEVPPQTRWGKLGDVLARRGRLVEIYQTSTALFTEEFLQQLLSATTTDRMRCGLPVERARAMSDMIGDQPALHAVSMLELSNYVGERLLRDTDAASMAVSLEARVPLLDHEVVEAIAAVPEHVRFQPLGKKQLLRDIALEDIDPAIFDRPKAGFELPIEIWSKANLRDEVEGMLCDEGQCAACGLDPEVVARLWRGYVGGAPGLYWSRIWAIFVLLWWCKEHRASI